MSNDLYNYELPSEKIALFPLEHRDNSKLLIYTNNTTLSNVFLNIHEFLPKNSLIIRNTTKVQKARLFFNNEKGRQFEIFCLHPYENNDKTHISYAKYECLVKGIKKLKLNEELIFNGVFEAKKLELKAKFIGRKEAYAIIEFSWNIEELSFEKILDEFGNIPLPPYIKREININDNYRYQTIYAHEYGSVAAPTAGLHFTNAVIEKLIKSNINFAEVILHVGLGTFKPLQDNNLRQHLMHSEYFTVTKDTIDALLANHNNSIIAVGTTTLRTLESLYLLAHQPLIEKQSFFNIKQWETDEIKSFLPPIEAWQKLAEYMARYQLLSIHGTTSLMITPAYRCKSIDYIITNFHQPNSTLLLIVSSLIGENWQNVYKYALKNDYRFLSYGDVCLFENIRK